VLQVDTSNIHALHNRGISYERLSLYEKAILDFSEVIRRDPDNANAYFNRGCCYDSVGELDLAIADYSVALELDMKM
jgi:tetratricopeptide (TPR) repeat protein